MNIPERIVSKGNMNIKLGEFNEKLKLLKSSYARLPILGEEAIPKNPNEITTERLAEYVKKMQTNLNAEQRNVWQKIYSDAAMQIKPIRDFFESFPDAEFVVTDNISQAIENRVACTNKSDVINKAAEVEVPDDCKAYFDKIQGLADAIHEMREYEKVHGIRKRSIEEMTYYADHAEEYAGLYVDGYFQKK